MLKRNTLLSVAIH